MTRSSQFLGRAAAVAGAVALAGACGAGAASAAPSSTGVAILAPSPAVAIIGAKVPVRLRTGARVTGVEAFIGTRDISTRFHRRGRTWTAMVPARVIGTGRRRLLVQARAKHGGGTDAETFTVARKDPHLLRGVKIHDAAKAVRVTAPTRGATTAVLTLNGHQVADIENPGATAHHTWELTPRDGLHAGRNRIIVTVLDRHGHAQTKSQTFARRAALGATAGPALAEQGLYVGTDLEVTGGNANTMYIAGTPYTSTLPAGKAEVMVQLDEKTLAPVATSLNGTTLQAQPGVITVATWENTSVPFSVAPNGSRIWIGTTEVADSESRNGSGDGGNSNTNLHGWLLPGSGVDPATWTDSDMINVQTRGAGEATNTNTMQIGGTSYTVNLPSGATGGFEALLLDNQGAPTAGPSVFALTGNAADDLASENQLAQYLQNAAGQNVTVMLQGFGELQQIDPTGSLAQAIAAVGGNADVIDRFGPIFNRVGPNHSPDSSGGDYALVSGRYTTPTGWDWHAQEASSERTGDGTLSALLVRDQTQNDYVPMTAAATTAGPLGSPEDALLPVIYQAPASWANWMPNGNGGLRAPTTAEQNAWNDIKSEIETNKWTASTPSTPSTPPELCPNAPDPVRGALCNTDQTKLSNIGSEIEEDLTFDPAKGTAGGYTATDFKNVQNAISQEFINASDIRSSIDDYQTIFGTSGVSGFVDADGISKAIQNNLRKSSDSTASNILSLLGAMAGMASGLDFGEDLDLAANLTFASGAFSTMGAFASDSGASNALADNVQVTQSTVAPNLVHAMQAASGQLAYYGDYLASDPVKLLDGAALLDGTYAMSGGGDTKTQNAFEDATNQYLWGKLLAAAYNVWTGPDTLGSNPTCFYGEPPTNEQDPFSNASPNATWPSVSKTTLTTWWIGQSVGADNLGISPGIALPAATADQLTGAIDPNAEPSQTTNVGAVQPYFDETYLGFDAVPLNPNPTNPYHNEGCAPHQPDSGTSGVTESGDGGGSR
jgi:hypothetical protein